MDGYGNTPATKARIIQAERLLLDGFSVPEVRRTISKEHGLSERQARSITSAACDRVADFWAVERPQLIATRMIQLEQLARKAIEAGQYRAALAAWIHADNLAQLIPKK